MRQFLQIDNEVNSVSGRHLLATVDAAGVNGTGVNVTDCFLMYYTQINVTVTSVNATGTSPATTSTTTLSGVPSTAGSTCGNGTAS